MDRLHYFVFCLLGYFVIGDTATVSFIKPCKPNDVACMKASAIAARSHFIAGVPEIGLPPADPIVLKEVRADDKDLKLGFNNMKVTGVNKCTILDFSRDLDKSTMSLFLECPLTVTGQYSLNGKLLFIAAEGEGDFEIKTEKVKIDVTVKVKTVDEANEKHWKITGFDYNYDIFGKADIRLDNLYGGDETRAKPIRDVLENSGKELIAEVGGPIIKELLSKEVEIVQKFFKSVPISALELS